MLEEGISRIGWGVYSLSAGGCTGVACYLITRWYTRKLYDSQYLEDLLEDSDGYDKTSADNFIESRNQSTEIDENDIGDPLMQYNSSEINGLEAMKVSVNKTASLLSDDR